MNLLSSLVMNRHAVLSKVVKDGTEYQLLIFTRRQDAADADTAVWHDMPRGGFLTEGDALRHAHYILLGVAGVREDGQPIFSVT